jgi:hypothetical protein
MKWDTIGDAEPLNPGGYDGSVWRWQLQQVDNADRNASVIVRISGTAMSMGEDALPPRVAAARETQGFSEVVQTLDWELPPDEIRLDSQRVVPSGGDPGPEGRELIEIEDWFEERGMLLIFAARGLGSADGTTIVSTTHSTHVVARDEDKYFNHFEGVTRLESARKAKAYWEGQQREIGQAVEEEEALPMKAVLSVERSQKVQTLRDQGKHLAWTEPTDPNDPVWALRVYNDKGELLAIGLGDDVEDALLEVAEELLPEDDAGH